MDGLVDHGGERRDFDLHLTVGSPDPVSSRPSATPRKADGAVGHRILIVDDNRDAADSLGLILKLKGSEVRVVYDGLEALAAAVDFRPTVVLLDIGLPSLNGYDVARELRRMPPTSDALLIATTGWSQPSDRERSRHAGFDHHLVKPIEPALLLAVLRNPKTPH